MKKQIAIFAALIGIVGCAHSEPSREVASGMPEGAQGMPARPQPKMGFSCTGTLSGEGVVKTTLIGSGSTATAVLQRDGHKEKNFKDGTFNTRENYYSFHYESGKTELKVRVSTDVTPVPGGGHPPIMGQLPEKEHPVKGMPAPGMPQRPSYRGEITIVDSGVKLDGKLNCFELYFAEEALIKE